MSDERKVPAAAVGADGPAGDGAGSDRPAGSGSGGSGSGAPGRFDTVPRAGRWLAGAVLVLLIVPGVLGLEAWPLTGWKLFSLSRDASQTAWVIEAVDAEGGSDTVDPEELPLGYRHAEWPMAELRTASDARRQAVCEALLGAVVDVEPGTVAVNILRDRQELVERDGEWVVTHDPEVVHTCTVEEMGS
ncbi:MAG TPA: hypothetical protein VIL48_19670 [Acidimicrobiales bacterium]